MLSQDKGRRGFAPYFDRINLEIQDGLKSLFVVADAAIQEKERESGLYRLNCPFSTSVVTLWHTTFRTRAVMDFKLLSCSPNETYG